MSDRLAGGVQDADGDVALTLLVMGVPDFAGVPHLGLRLGHLRRRTPGTVRHDMQGIEDVQPHVAVDAAALVPPAFRMRGVHADGDHVRTMAGWQ